ncbi:predicted protein [Histoplasma capsulatum var. duboisii H88]|uniref:Predicted protein n=2 Tax=Ajellomyces capsulatus TaxID=5037 RepID=F0UN25_AJEC8|nr:predicted protein [Histoplasma capsulatum H143]EGC47492.1 predicted protein [Histoplasma capsulatum var. duboisii H88]
MIDTKIQALLLRSNNSRSATKSHSSLRKVRAEEALLLIQFKKIKKGTLLESRCLPNRRNEHGEKQEERKKQRKEERKAEDRPAQRAEFKIASELHGPSGAKRLWR